MEHSEGTFQGTGGLALYYQCWRPAIAPARAVIVMQHGDFAHSGWYMNLPAYEVVQGCAVYAFDRRGWGRSPGQRGFIQSWSEYLDDLDAFLDRVQTNEPGCPIFLMGHTGSSPLVLEYALRQPQRVRGVFCVSPVLDMSATVPAGLRRLLRVLSRIWPRLSLDVKRQFEAAAPYISHDPAFVKFILEDPLRNTKITPRWFVESENAMGRVSTQAVNFPVPLLILIGSADRNSAIETTKAFFQQVASADKELREYPGAYVNLLSDSVYETALNDIDRWLDKHIP